MRGVEYTIEQLTCCLLENWEAYALYQRSGSCRSDPGVVEILAHLGHAQVLSAAQFRYVIRKVNIGLDGVYRLTASYWGDKED